MLCCLVGGVLVAALARSARRRKTHSPLLALLFGFGAGALVVALATAILVPLGGADARGPLPARLALLIVPALVAVGTGAAGAAGSLLVRSGVMTVTTAAIAGGVAAEEIDLHLLHLHTASGVVPAIAIHAPAFVFLLAGLRWRSKLPSTTENPSCDGRAGPEPAVVQAKRTMQAAPTTTQ
jgi:hypothetical protein